VIGRGLAVVLGLAWAAAGAVSAHTPPSAESCRCASVRESAGWCTHCGVGYAAGLRVESATLLEAIDLQGHDVDAGSLECASCRTAAARDGICSSCGWGFAAGRLHVSKLAWGLALGRLENPADLACGTCRALASASGWCDGCAKGWIGRFAFTDAELHTLVEQEHRRLRRALTLLDRCESCAVAHFTGSVCPEHAPD
jgi:hypothetical protein